MNLKTEEGRKSAIEAIEQSFINSIREIGVELSETAYCTLNDFITVIYYSKKSTFGVNIYSKTSSHEKNKLNIYSTSSFTPTDNETQYWNIIHAASILKNWEDVCHAVNDHCKQYSELIEQIKKENC